MLSFFSGLIEQKTQSKGFSESSFWTYHFLVILLADKNISEIQFINTAYSTYTYFLERKNRYFWPTRPSLWPNPPFNMVRNLISSVVCMTKTSS